MSGGAVELSWALRSTQDVGIECEDAPIERMALEWATDSDTRSSKRHQTFPCDDNHGVTSFDVPIGTVELTVWPVCAGGIAAKDESFTAPPPIVREIALGEAATLDAILLVVQIDDCDKHTCVCRPPPEAGRR